MKKQCLLYFLVLCCNLFNAGAQTTHIIHKTTGIPVEIPEYEAGDILRIVGDELEDYELLTNLPRKYHLDLSNNQISFPGFDSKNMLSISAPFIEIISETWSLNNELKCISFPSLRKAHCMGLVQFNSLESMFCPLLEELDESSFYHYWQSTFSLPKLKSIGQWFAYSATMKSLYLPNLQETEGGFCHDTPQLSYVYLPKIESLETFALSTNLSLKSIYLPNAKRLDRLVFTDSRLESLFIPKIEEIRGYDAGDPFRPNPLRLVYWETRNPQVGINTIIERNLNPILLLTPYADEAELEKMNFPEGSKALQTNQINPFDIFLLPGDELNISVDIEGISNLQWKKDGITLSEANDLSYKKSPVTKEDAGLYTLSFTYDLNGDDIIDEKEHYTLAGTKVIIGSKPSISGPSSLEALLGDAITPVQFEFTELNVIRCAGFLPQGMSMNETTGVLSGTPSVAGKYTLWLHGDNDYSLHAGETPMHQFIIDVIDSSVPVQYTITASASEGGSISPSGTQSINPGSSQSFSFSPNTGYYTHDVLVDGVSNPEAVEAGSYTFENIQTYHEIYVYFGREEYTIEVSTSEGGWINPGGRDDAQYGDSHIYNIFPDPGYHISRVLVDGENNREAVVQGYYSLKVTGNHTIHAEFSNRQTYTITAGAGKGGSISPSGDIPVASKQDIQFFFTPDKGYRISRVLVDGEECPEAVETGYYPFYHVTEDHTIHVEFARKEYTVTTVVSGNGSVSPGGDQTLLYYDEIILDLIPEPGYYTALVLVNGITRYDAMQNNKLHLVYISQDLSVYVEFAKQQEHIFSITTNGIGGKANPEGGISVLSGNDLSVCFTPDEGYLIGHIYVDGQFWSCGTDSCLHYVNIREDHFIEVEFVEQTNHYISACTSPGGSIVPSGDIPVFSKSDMCFEFFPDEGHYISLLNVDGVEEPIEYETRCFYCVTGEHGIYVEFAKHQYTISASAGEGGSISPEGETTLLYGEEMTFYFTPDKGYYISSVRINGEICPEAAEQGFYSFNPVKGNTTIHVEFARQTYEIDALANEGGSINPSGKLVLIEGSDQLYTFTPDPGYYINRVLINGENNPEAVEQGYYFFGKINQHYSIYVEFARRIYTITASAGQGGSISPNGKLSILHGANQLYIFTPLGDYYISKVLIDGLSHQQAKEQGYYFFQNITEDHSIAVSFAKKEVQEEPEPEPNDPEPLSTRLQSLSLTNGRIVPDFSPQTKAYTVYLDCGASTSELDYTAESKNARVSVLGSLSFPTPGSHTVSVQVQDGTEQDSYVLTCIRPFDQVVVPVWDNVLSVINNPQHNGGYRFTAYQWYRDREMKLALPGETSGNLYLENDKNTNPDYTVWLTTSDGISACGCRVNTETPARSARVYPNPAQRILTVEQGEAAEATIEIYDLRGKLIRKYRTGSAISDLDISEILPGTYIVRIGNESFLITKTL